MRGKMSKVFFGGVCVLVFTLGFTVSQLVNETIIFKTESMTEYDFIEQLQVKFAENHEYNISNYNCVNYSSDFMQVGKHLGYDIEVIGGTENETSEFGHVWNSLSIEIEPQNKGKVGYFLKDYYQEYSEEYLTKYNE